jgi:hypothetical protein
MFQRSKHFCRWIVLVAVVLVSATALASVTASISGTVRDPSGLAIVGATVTATNTETGIAQTLRTNGQGYYTFQSIPLGRYNLEVQQSGFRPFRETGLVLDVNAALVVDVTLQVGEAKEAVTVSSTAVHVETATTQLGEVISAPEMTGVPLVSRSYTDLLALQPGVSATSSGIGGGGGGAANTGSNFIAAGFAVTPVSGSLDAGNVSVNGAREANNGFLLNGATVQEFGFGGTSVIPNLDSIAEFRIITNNFDAEYGNYSGGQINVITKSGANQLHGDVFEFLRNTSLDARDYFTPVSQGRRTYHQNQFGGTLGGPIKRDKIFFFGDYQGNRIVQGISSGLIPVPSTAELGGDFSQVLTSTGQNAMIGHTVNGLAWASTLSSALPYPVSAGENYYAPGCTATGATPCVFPGAKIPTNIFSTIANNLVKYIPPANSGDFFSTSAFAQRLRDDKTSGRVDENSRLGMLSAYYFYDDYSLNNPYSSASTLPGFNTLSTGKTQVINLGDTKSIGNSSVNEARFQYVRSRNLTNPSGGIGVKLSSLGFTGITPLNPAAEGVPETDFNSFQFGTLSRIFGLTENTFQGVDNYRKLIGKHTLSFGGSYHYTQLQEKLRNVENGNYQFFGTETGIDFADFLLGAPSFYIQGQTPASNGRNRYVGVYGQDSWRATSDLTLNYGLRWEVSTPWYEKNNEIETIVPGLQSKVFPNSPIGWVFPGDPGIPRTLAPTRYNNFAPRVGFAYSPSHATGWLSKLTGAGQTSIRAGYGLFYTAFEGATDFNEIGDAPYGDYYNPSNPGYANPFENRPNGAIAKNPFPITLPVPKDFDFAGHGFLPIGSSPGFYYKNRLPYSEQYELSIQRQFSSSTLLTISYVGTQAHRLLSTQEANPGVPAICNYLNANGASPACLPSGENSANIYVLPFGVALPPGLPTGPTSIATTAPCATDATETCNAVLGTRTVLGPLFTTNGYFITNGNSAYNSVQVNLRRTAKRLSFLAGYTYSKSLDDSSAYGEQVNPFNPRLSRALSAFDQTHNFVLSYSYNLPLDKLGGPKRLTGGWQLSGITRFATGVPVTLYETDDNSLLGTAGAGPLPIGIDTPVFTGTSVHFENPRTTGDYFDPAQFTFEPIGSLGGRRRFFHGPGLNNWDMALLKNTHLTERMNLQFRAEFFNLMNHAQFNAANGNINNATFGSVLSTQPSRVGQMSLKLLF